MSSCNSCCSASVSGGAGSSSSSSSNSIGNMSLTVLPFGSRIVWMLAYTISASSWWVRVLRLR